MTWTQTYQAKALDLNDPDPADIELDDIAHHLAHQCRFLGATVTHYSVAQHCVHMAEEQQSADMALYCLLHDAHEAYTGDISQPMKEMLAKETMVLGAIQYRVQEAIYRALEVPPPCPAIVSAVKAADLRMLAAERDSLMRNPPKTWACLVGVEPYHTHVRPWSIITARTEFLITASHLLQLMSEN